MNAQLNEQLEKGRRRGQWTIAFIIIGFAFYLTLPLYYLKIMALDYSALLSNFLLEPIADDPLPWYANNYFIRIGNFLLQWGALPFFLLLVGHLGSRLDLYRKNGCIVQFPQKHKVLLLTAFYVPFLLFCFPFSLAFSVWISVEAFWWVQWYNHINFITNDLLPLIPYFLFPMLCLLGIYLMHACFSAKSNKNVGGSHPLFFWTLRLLRMAVVILILILVVSIGGIGLLHASRITTINGPKVYRNKCAGCHDFYLPLYLVKTPNEWRRTIENQINIEKVALTAHEKECITQFLLGMRSFPDSWTFLTRCQRCHFFSPYRWEKRTPDDWENIINRVAKWSPYYYNFDVRQQILNFLVENFSQESNTFGFSPEAFTNYQIVGKTCSQCHSLSYEAERYQYVDQRTIAKMVSRMSRKMPTAIKDQEINFYALTFREMILDQTAFQRMFPHDLPVLKGRLPW